MATAEPIISGEGHQETPPELAVSVLTDPEVLRQLDAQVQASEEGRTKALTLDEYDAEYLT